MTPAKADRQNALWRAIHESDIAGIHAAVKAGADPDEIHSGAAPPLIEVMGLGLRESFIAMLEHSDVNARNRRGLTPLMWASEMGLVEEIDLLLSKGAHPLASDAHGRTALICAASAAEASAVQALLGVSDPLAVDKDGQSALMLAAWAGSMRCARLLAPVSDLRARDKHGASALELCAGHAELAGFLRAAIEATELGGCVEGSISGMGRRGRAPGL